MLTQVSDCKLFNIVMTKVESSVLVCKPRYLPTMTDSSNLFISTPPNFIHNMMFKLSTAFLAVATLFVTVNALADNPGI